MSLTASRRDILKFLGGSIAGVMVTPIPWKLLDDTAIWTQTGPWISKLPRGSVSSRFGTCTICPASCGVRVRSVNGVPFAVQPVRSHPLSQGGLCATGTAGHHLAYHPLRLHSTVRITQSDTLREATPISLEEIEAAVRTAMQQGREGSVAVLDQRPGRTASLFYRKILKNARGVYVVAPSDESLMFEGFQAMSGESLGSLGVDIEHAKLVVSFGVPVLENHGTLGRVTKALANRSQKFIQIESGSSRTGVLADECLSILPGTEAVVALGIANILLHGRATRGPWARNAAYREKVDQFTPSLVATTAGITERQLTALANEMAATEHVVVLGGPNPSTGSRSLPEDTAIWGLNLLLGQFGSAGGVLERSEVPASPTFRDSQIVPFTNLRDVPDGSISVLLIDASQAGAPLPWNSLNRKLDPAHHVTVVLTPTISGLARFADFALPTAAPYETLTDTVTPAGSVVPSFGLAAPMLQPPVRVVDPVEFIGALMGNRQTTEALLRERIERIHSSKRGKVFVPSSEKTIVVKDLIAADDLATLLLEGGIWVDENIPHQKSRHFDVFGIRKERSVASVRMPSSEKGIPLVFEGRRNAAMHSQMPPTMSKLVQESELWSSDAYVQMHPDTAVAAGLEEDMNVAVCIGSGEQRAKVRLHSGLRPGIVQMAIGCSPVTVGADHIEFGSEILDLVEPDEDLGWGGARIVLRKV